MIRTTARQLGALLLPALLLSGASTAPAQEAPTKIAVVDIEKVVVGSTAGKQLQKRLDDFRALVEVELKAKADELEALRKRAEAAGTVTEGDRLRRQLEQGVIDFDRLKADKQREGQKIQQDGLNAIEKALAPVFRQVRDEQGYDLILALTPGVVLMTSKRVDITQLVIERYNAAQ